MDQDFKALSEFLRILNGLGGGAIFIFAFMYFIYPRISKSGANGNSSTAPTAILQRTSDDDLKKTCDNNMRDVRTIVNEIFLKCNETHTETLELARRFDCLERKFEKIRRPE